MVLTYIGPSIREQLHWAKSTQKVFANLNGYENREGALTETVCSRVWVIVSAVWLCSNKPLTLLPFHSTSPGSLCPGKASLYAPINSSRRAAFAAILTVNWSGWLDLNKQTPGALLFCLYALGRLETVWVVTVQN